jgi:peptidyl-prolyl cis-trans isomerase SDCCAG10
MVAGGESIWGSDFPKEFHSRLRFSHRGVVAMAGGADGNQSQFFITLTATPQLDRQHTIFGKLTGNAIYNILQVNDLELNGDRPVQPPKIISVDVLANPFDDIVPREKRTQVTPAAPVNSGPKVKKNYKLLSFGDEAEEEVRQLFSR